MTDGPDVVALMWDAVNEALAWAGPEATEAVLNAVALVPYRGDDHAYREEAIPVIVAAAQAAVQPRIDAGLADIAASRARIAELNAQQAKFMREFEQFRQMRTPPTIQ